MKKYKTPLRYPGGKSRGTKKFSPSFPKQFSEFREPFLGGGSVAIHVSKTYPDAKVWVNDKYFNLYNFWMQLRDNGDKLYKTLLDIKTPLVYQTKSIRKKHGKEITEKINELNPTNTLWWLQGFLSSAEKKQIKEEIKKQVKEQYISKESLEKIQKHKELFDTARNNINNVDNFTKAVYFYILNKCSFSGLGESSSFSEQASEQNFSLNGINALPYYSKLIKNWKITNIDYEEVMNTSGDNCFVFLDPPYDIKDNLYGKNGNMHSGFDHMRFY